LDDRLPWAGRNGWAQACIDFGFFVQRIGKAWVPCEADAPRARPDVDRLLRECRWSREDKRFEPRRKKSRRRTTD
jgi:hypothetical protein